MPAFLDMEETHLFAQRSNFWEIVAILTCFIDHSDVTVLSVKSAHDLDENTAVHIIFEHSKLNR